uniref:Uncharacterized protein n=1 Tax=viral metagenome TaxID=1070528 RepID=A0A6C0HWK0_9ZZZZ
MAFYPGQVITLDQLRSGFSSKPKSTKFSAKDISTMDELNEQLHEYVNEAFDKLQTETRALIKNSTPAPIDTNRIIKDVKASIKTDIAAYLKEANTIDGLSRQIIANSNFKKELNASIKEQFETLSRSLISKLDAEQAKLSTTHASILVEQGTLKTEQAKLSTTHASILAEQGTLKTAHASLLNAHNAINAKITALETKPASTPAELESLKSRLQTLETSQKSITDISARLGLLETYLDSSVKTNITRLINAFPSMSEVQIKGALDKINGVLGSITKEDIELLKGFNRRIETLSGRLDTKATMDDISGISKAVAALKKDLEAAKLLIPDITKDKFNALSTKVDNIAHEITRHDGLIDKKVSKPEVIQIINDINKTKREGTYVDPAYLSQNTSRGDYMTVGEVNEDDITVGAAPKEPSTFFGRIGNAFASLPYAFGGIDEPNTPKPVTPNPVTASRSSSVLPGSKKNKYLKRGSISESSDELALNNTLSDTSVN